MKSSLIAAGGVLLAAATVFVSAGSANADQWVDWTHHYPNHCGIGVNDDSTYHHVTRNGIYAGTRDADACKNYGNYGNYGKHGNYYWGQDRHHHGHDHWLHRNWPTSGNGNWVRDWLRPGVYGR
ncbi:hypothetical protein [Nonomuraea sp. NPDC002799]